MDPFDNVNIEEFENMFQQMEDEVKMLEQEITKQEVLEDQRKVKEETLRQELIAAGLDPDNLNSCIDIITKSLTYLEKEFEEKLTEVKNQLNAGSIPTVESPI